MRGIRMGQARDMSIIATAVLVCCLAGRSTALPWDSPNAGGESTRPRGYPHTASGGSTSQRQFKMSTSLPSMGGEILTNLRGACPCENASLCERIQGRRDKEYFGFGSDGWESFDWSRITSVAWSDPSIVCRAHQAGARLIAGTLPLIFSSSKLERRIWIKNLVAMLRDNFYDGVTFDYEEPMDARSPDSATYIQSQQYVALVRETTLVLHEQLPGSQVSVCAAWSPDGIDGRHYDYSALAEASDYLYVMAYDVRSQVFEERCTASANSPIKAAEQGVARYLALGIPPSKLILGTPWYGYVYQCISGGLAPGEACEIERVPFRDANCSDAAGNQTTFMGVMDLFDNGICPGDLIEPCEVAAGAMMWDEATLSPYFTFTSGGRVYQAWFDDAKSSGIKYGLAASMGLGGVGPYRFDQLDPSGARTGNPRAPAEAQSMWASLSSFDRPANW